MIIYVHITKTAGGTLHKIIENYYQKEEVFIFHTAISRNSNCFKEIQDIPEKTLQKLKYITGHIPYGMHELINRPCVYLVTMRNPVDIVLSVYYFIQQHPHLLAQYPALKQMSLSDFIESKHSLSQNIQIRYLRGNQIDFDIPVTKEHLNNSIDNIKLDNTTVGLTEYFDESLILFKNLYGWETINFYPVNLTPNKPKKDSVPKNIINKIIDNNQYDLFLLEEVKN